MLRQKTVINKDYFGNRSLKLTANAAPFARFLKKRTNIEFKSATKVATELHKPIETKVN